MLCACTYILRANVLCVYVCLCVSVRDVCMCLSRVVSHSHHQTCFTHIPPTSYIGSYRAPVGLKCIVSQTNSPICHHHNQAQSNHHHTHTQRTLGGRWSSCFPVPASQATEMFKPYRTDEYARPTRQKHERRHVQQLPKERDPSLHSLFPLQIVIPTFRHSVSSPHSYDPNNHPKHLKWIQ